VREEKLIGPPATAANHAGSIQMTTYQKRLRRHILRDELFDRELDFLPKTIARDDVREIARRYGPQRKRSALGRAFRGLVDFFFRYTSPFLGMIVGAEYAAAKALYPLIGEQKQFGDSLKLFLGEDLGAKVEDMSKAFEIAGTLMAATPKIVSAALYGALFGILTYIILKRLLILAISLRRKLVINRKVSGLLG
jgi:hypothetical protein